MPQVHVLITEVPLQALRVDAHVASGHPDQPSPPWCLSCGSPASRQMNLQGALLALLPI